MQHEFNPSGPIEALRIQDSDLAVQFWAWVLKTTTANVRQAMKSVGDEVLDVAEYLQGLEAHDEVRHDWH